MGGRLDSNLDLHSAPVFVYFLDQGTRMRRGWGMSGLGGARVRGFGCPVGTLVKKAMC